MPRLRLLLVLLLLLLKLLGLRVFIEATWSGVEVVLLRIPLQNRLLMMLRLTSLRPTLKLTVMIRHPQAVASIRWLWLRRIFSGLALLSRSSSARIPLLQWMTMLDRLLLKAWLINFGL